MCGRKAGKYRLGIGDDVLRLVIARNSVLASAATTISLSRSVKTIQRLLDDYPHPRGWLAEDDNRHRRAAIPCKRS